MRASRRPLTARPDNRITSSMAKKPSIPKSKQTIKALNSLSNYLSRFEQIDQTIFETSTSLNSFICDLLSFTQANSASREESTEYIKRWAIIRNQLANNIITINNSKISEKIDEDFVKLNSIINQVEQAPPSSQKGQKDSKMMLKTIKTALNSARDSSNKKQYDKLKAQMQNFRSDLSHQYESFFRISQIDKSWKETIIDECKRIIDRIISFCDIGKETGITNFPFVDEITKLMDEFGTESPLREARSLIPRHSPMKDLRRIRKGDDSQTPTKEYSGRINRVGSSSRSKSEQSNKVSKIPKPNTPDRRANPVNTIKKTAKNDFDSETKPKNTSTLNSTRNKVKPARSASLSNTGQAHKKKMENTKEAKSKEIVSLHDSPKILIKTAPLSSSMNIASKKINVDSDSESTTTSETPSQTASKFRMMTKKNTNDVNQKLANDSVNKAIEELKAFDQRFARYVATVGTNDLFGRFINEIHATQNDDDIDIFKLQTHLGRLQNLVKQIENKIEMSRPLYEIEQRFDQSLNQMEQLSKSIKLACVKHSEYPESNALMNQYESVKEQLENIYKERTQNAIQDLTEKLETNIQIFKTAEETFKNAHESNNMIKKLRKENADLKKESTALKSSNNDMKKEVDEINKNIIALKNENNELKTKIQEQADISNSINHHKEKYNKIIIEMKVVHARILSIQAERKDNPEDIEELEEELEALLEQQTGLIEQLNSIDQSS